MCGKFDVIHMSLIVGLLIPLEILYCMITSFGLQKNNNNNLCVLYHIHAFICSIIYINIGNKMILIKLGNKMILKM